MNKKLKEFSSPIVEMLAVVCLGTILQHLLTLLLHVNTDRTYTVVGRAWSIALAWSLAWIVVRRIQR